MLGRLFPFVMLVPMCGAIAGCPGQPAKDSCSPPVPKPEARAERVAVKGLCETLHIGGRCGPIAVAPSGDVLAVGTWGRGAPGSVSDGAVRGSAHRVKVWVAADCRSLAFSPTAPLFAGASRASSGGLVRGWDAGEGRELFSLAHTRVPASIAFSPDGKTLAAAEGPCVRFWDIQTLRSRLVFDQRRSAFSAGPIPCDVRQIRYSPDGRMLAILVPEGPILWDVGTERERALIPVRNYGTLAAAFSPDGSSLAVVDSRGIVYLCDPAAFCVVRELDQRHEGTATCLCFSPDGSLLAAALPFHVHAPSRLVVWDVRTGNELAAFVCHEEYMGDVAFFPDGKRIATAGADACVRIWDVAAITGNGGSGDAPDER